MDHNVMLKLELVLSITLLIEVKLTTMWESRKVMIAND